MLAYSILCLSQIRVEADIQWTLLVQFVLGHPFVLFHPATGFPSATSKAYWFKWVMSPEKKHWIGITFVGANFRHFHISVPFFQKMLQCFIWKTYISNNNKIFLIFCFVFIVSNLVFIYFRNNHCNCRLMCLILHYITDNLKGNCNYYRCCYTINLS